MKISGNNGGDFQQPEPGTYLARCYKIVDLGTQTGEYQGKPYSRRQVVLFWELPTELIETGDYAGQPLSVSKFYTASTFKSSNLTHDLCTWFPTKLTPDKLHAEGFDTGLLLGLSCQVTLTTTESGKVRVTSVTEPPKGTKVPKQINESVNFDLDNFDPAAYESLSDWFKETIAKSPEFELATKGKPATEDFADVRFDDEEPPF